MMAKFTQVVEGASPMPSVRPYYASYTDAVVLVVEFMARLGPTRLLPMGVYLQHNSRSRRRSLW